MINRIKLYFEYRKNKKTAKREIVKIASSTLPVLREFSENRSEILNFIKNLSISAKNMEESELIKMTLTSIAEMLSVKESRLLETASYIANMSPDDIQKIIVHAVVETNNPK